MQANLVSLFRLLLHLRCVSHFNSLSLSLSLSLLLSLPFLSVLFFFITHTHRVLQRFEPFFRALYGPMGASISVDGSLPSTINASGNVDRNDHRHNHLPPPALVIGLHIRTGDTPFKEQSETMLDGHTFSLSDVDFLVRNKYARAFLCAQALEQRLRTQLPIGSRVVWYVAP
jgi:hypothetical protein